jgi:hypothetical protein
MRSGDFMNRIVERPGKTKSSARKITKRAAFATSSPEFEVDDGSMFAI